MTADALPTACSLHRTALAPRRMCPTWRTPHELLWELWRLPAGPSKPPTEVRRGKRCPSPSPTAVACLPCAVLCTRAALPGTLPGALPGGCNLHALVRTTILDSSRHAQPPTPLPYLYPLAAVLGLSQVCVCTHRWRGKAGALHRHVCALIPRLESAEGGQAATGGPGRSVKVWGLPGTAHVPCPCCAQRKRF